MNRVIVAIIVVVIILIVAALVLNQFSLEQQTMTQLESEYNTLKDATVYG